MGHSMHILADTKRHYQCWLIIFQKRVFFFSCCGCELFCKQCKIQSSGWSSNYSWTSEPQNSTNKACWGGMQSTLSWQGQRVIYVIHLRMLYCTTLCLRSSLFDFLSKQQYVLQIHLQHHKKNTFKNDAMRSAFGNLFLMSSLTFAFGQHMQIQGRYKNAWHLHAEWKQIVTINSLNSASNCHKKCWFPAPTLPPMRLTTQERTNVFKCYNWEK